MGNIYIGTSKLKNCYIGLSKTKKIYMDTTMIWQSAIPVAKPTQLTPSGTYSGSEITNGYVCPSGVILSGSASGTNAGTYVATYTPDADHIWEDTEDRTPVTVTLTIAQKSISGATVNLNATSKTYNGSSQSVSVSSVVLSGYSPTYTVGGTTSATNVGTYTVTVTGNGNYTGSASATWTMNVLVLTIPSLSNTTQNYSGSAKSVTVNNYNSSFENQSGTASATNGGNYTVSWTLKSTTNTKWSDNTTGTKSASWLIQYVWNKYNSVLSYSQATTGVYSSSKLSLMTNIKCGDFTVYSTRGSAYSFDSSNGKFTLTSGVLRTSFTPSTSSLAQSNRLTQNYYWSNLYTTNTTLNPVDFLVKNASGSYTYIHAGSTDGESYTYKDIWMYASTSGTQYYSTGTYSKGSTSYGTVANTTNSSAYPTNGRASDGYWYVKTW